MRPLRALGRGTRATARGTGRVLGAPLRGAWRGAVATARWTGMAGEVGRVRRRRVGIGLTWLVAVVFFWIAFGTAGTTYDIGRIGDGLRPFIGLAVGAPLLFVATRRPLTGWALSLAGAVAFGFVPLVNRDPWPWTVVHGLAMLALLFAVCVRESAVRAAGAWLLTAGVWGWLVAPDVTGGWVVGVSVVAVLGLLAGRLFRTQRALSRQEQVSEEEKARRILLEERSRIARDLHDIVAHHMSLVVVQSETAPYRVPGLSEEARAELESIGASARSALTETRALLAVLRQEDAPAEHAPQPGLELVDDLVDGARRAGVVVESSVRGDLAGLRPGTSLAGYRIVQEALANASRHAPGATVRVEVDRGRELTLAVVNGPVPGGRSPGPVPGAGHGLLGMRERVAAEGGTLHAGPEPDGGFAVRVTLPAPETAGSSPVTAEVTSEVTSEEAVP